MRGGPTLERIRIDDHASRSYSATVPLFISVQCLAPGLEPTYRTISDLPMRASSLGQLVLALGPRSEELYVKHMSLPARRTQ